MSHNDKDAEAQIVKELGQKQAALMKQNAPTRISAF
jgi:hypothetical protein